MTAQQAVIHFENKNYAKTTAYLKSILTYINKGRDSGLARLYSESLSALGNIEEAIKWRKKAISWAKKPNKDYEALIWLFLKKNDIKQALQLHSFANKKQKKVLNLHLAQSAFDKKSYTKALNLIESSFSAPYSAPELTIKAWSHYHLKHSKHALISFKRLYKLEPTIGHASGWLYSALATHQLVKKLPNYQKDQGPLGLITNDQYIRDFYKLKQKKVSSRKADPEIENLIILARERIASHRLEELEKESKNLLESQSIISSLQPWTTKFQRHAFARSFAAHYENIASIQDNDTKASIFNSALHWRTQAITWSQETEFDIRAMIRSHIALGNFNKAKQLSKRLDTASARLVSKELLSIQATLAYKQNRYDSVLDIYNQLSEIRSLKANELEIKGWSHYQLQDYDDALESFSSSYQLSADSLGCSQGIMFSAYQSNQLDKAAKLAQNFSGPLKKLFINRNTLESAIAGLDKSDALINSKAILSLQPRQKSFLITSSGLKLRYRSGESGMGQLLTIHSPETRIHFTMNNSSSLQAKFSLLQLSTGTPDKNALIGSLTDTEICPSGGEPENCNQLTDANNNTPLMLETYFQYGASFNAHKIEIGLGSTPLSGELSPSLLGRIAYTNADKISGFQLAIERDAVKESLLSYVGQIDPYSKQTWGRVTKNSFKGSIYSQLSKNWKLNAEGRISHYKGIRTEENNSLNLYASLDSQSDFINNASLSFGPVLNFIHFEKNLNGHTLGHGGYFSPQTFIRLSYNLDYFYSHSDAVIFRAKWEPGLQFHTEDCLIDYTKNAGSCYQKSSQANDLSNDFRAGVMKKLDKSNHMLGADFSYNMSPDFSEWQIWLYWQYSIETKPMETFFKLGNQW